MPLPAAGVLVVVPPRPQKPESRWRLSQYLILTRERTACIYAP
jgi:hypothetical protein